MPATVRRRQGQYRVVEPSGRLVRRNGSPVDGGGFSQRNRAERQARAINRSK